ncbi:MAG: 4'-phosphopantetheinyl transferase superfamily protein, partial [Fibrobacter sp.]|nr:4'-phosphopantetheinyl transferase superfamily protein [Fibrobacter sp.]
VKNVREGLADRFFSDMEKKMLNESQSKESFDDLFFKMWVLKESYIKAIGKGLSCPLSSFSVLPHSNNNVELFLHDQALPEKYFRLYDISPHYRCAVCTTNNQLPRDVEILTVNEMVA